MLYIPPFNLLAPPRIGKYPAQSRQMDFYYDLFFMKDVLFRWRISHSLWRLFGVYDGQTGFCLYINRYNSREQVTLWSVLVRLSLDDSVTPLWHWVPSVMLLNFFSYVGCMNDLPSQELHGLLMVFFSFPFHGHSDSSSHLTWELRPLTLSCLFVPRLNLPPMHKVPLKLSKHPFPFNLLTT